MAPMGLGYSDPEGYASEQDCAFYAAVAKGGTGLIVAGVTSTNRIAYETFGGVGQMALLTLEHMRALSLLADRVHAFDAKIFLQLSPGPGRQGTSRRTGTQPVAPSVTTYVMKKVPCREECATSRTARAKSPGS